MQSYEDKVNQISSYFDQLQLECFKVQKVNDSNKNFKPTLQSLFEISAMNTNYIKKSKIPIQQL